MGILPEHFPYVLRALGLKPTVPADPGAITIHAITRLDSAPVARSMSLNGGASTDLTALASGVLMAPLPFTGDLTGSAGTPVDLALTWSALDGATPMPIDDGIDDVLLLINYELAPV